MKNEEILKFLNWRYAVKICDKNKKIKDLIYLTQNLYN